MSVHPDADDWEDLLNPMLKQVFGWGEEETCDSVKEMMCHACMSYDFAPRNWTCPSCKGNSTTAKHRCAV